MVLQVSTQCDNVTSVHLFLCKTSPMIMSNILERGSIIEPLYTQENQPKCHKIYTNIKRSISTYTEHEKQSHRKKQFLHKHITNQLRSCGGVAQNTDRQEPRQGQQSIQRALWVCVGLGVCCLLGSQKFGCPNHTSIGAIWYDMGLIWIRPLFKHGSSVMLDTGWGKAKIT